jgi:hypothetical protein
MAENRCGLRIDFAVRQRYTCTMLSRRDVAIIRAEIERLEKARKAESTEVIEEKGEKWCARRDSNSRPIAPEAIALSI